MENNTTLVDITTASLSASTSSSPISWSEVVNIIQGVILIWGIATNLVTVISLIKYNVGFSRHCCALIKHQSILDLLACLCGFIISVQAKYWSTENKGFNYFMCHVWHSQTIYWYFMLASIHNLVYIAIERYTAIVLPLQYKVSSNFTLLKIYSFLYLFLTFYYSIATYHYILSHLLFSHFRDV